LIFYRDFNSVVLLDNQLSEISKINFSDFDIVAQTCSMASKNRFWVYDNLTSSLFLFDYLNKKKTTVNQPFRSDFKYWKSDYNYPTCDCSSSKRRSMKHHSHHDYS